MRQITTEFVHSLMIAAQDLSRLAGETGLAVVWTSFSFIPSTMGELGVFSDCYFRLDLTLPLEINTAMPVSCLLSPQDILQLQRCNTMR